MRYRGLIIGAAVLFAIWQLISARAIDWRPGMLVDAEPLQTDLQDPRPFAFKDVQLTPRARFKAEVRVLHRERYWLGPFAQVAPLDIAVGWGAMSDSAVLADIDISQSGRFYFWHYDDEPPIPREVIETHSANWHLIPARNAVWSTLRGLRIGDVVTLEGQLVDVQGADGSSAKTSLRRDDTGAGACEILWVESATLRYH